MGMPGVTYTPGMPDTYVHGTAPTEQERLAALNRLTNDIPAMRLDPPCPAFDAAWQALAAYQQTLGGDALIGRRLFRLFRNAGFADVTLSLQPEVHWSGLPGFDEWMRNVIGNIDSARRGMDADVADRAVTELEAFARRDDASCIFYWNRAVGTVPARPAALVGQA